MKFIEERVRAAAADRKRLLEEEKHKEQLEHMPVNESVDNLGRPVI